MDGAAAFLTAMSPLEAASVAFSLAYLVLAVQQNVLCWPAALIATLLSLGPFIEARLYPESALQIFYAAMAVYGWRQWRRKDQSSDAATAELRVGTWPWAYHGLAIAGSLLAAGALGTLLSRTDAAFPYLDSFTTVGAVVTTYMVAKKILENWIYWFVIDGLTVYIYWSRELYLFAGLFVIYLVLVVLGFYRWHRDWRAQQALAQRAQQALA
jgi:nicotinamide mononucleotide transporter